MRGSVKKPPKWPLLDWCVCVCVVCGDQIVWIRTGTTRCIWKNLEQKEKQSRLDMTKGCLQGKRDQRE